MFDCISKKSEIKEESYNYEYESKTSQNIIRAENDEVDNENNYELSDDGICLQNCSHCTETRCIKCKKNYELLGNKSNDEIICVNKSLLNIGYYKDENASIYYKCGDNCERCLNDINCIKCNSNYTKINNINSSCYLINDLIPFYSPDPNDEYGYLSCDLLYKNCLTCNNEQCLSCNTSSEYKYLIDTEGFGRNCVKECPSETILKDGKCVLDDKENTNLLIIIIPSIIVGIIIIIIIIIIIYCRYKNRRIEVTVDNTEIVELSKTFEL
jgi:hypothetical protein